jgi:hypothetical protein
MINESYFWKKELYKCFFTIARFRHLKRITEQSYVKVEKALMIGAYIIRRLDDAQKIPPNFLTKKEKLKFYKTKGKIVDHLNWHRIDNYYNFDKEIIIEKDWRFIINQIIHSFSLVFSFDGFNRFDGFLINSDKTKKQALFFLPLKDLLKIFLTISEGNITKASLQRKNIDKDSNDYLEFVEMKLTNAVYSYPFNFNINRAIEDSMKGMIYKRKNE